MPWIRSALRLIPSWSRAYKWDTTVGLEGSRGHIIWATCPKTSSSSDMASPPPGKLNPLPPPASRQPQPHDWPQLTGTHSSNQGACLWLLSHALSFLVSQRPNCFQIASQSKAPKEGRKGLVMKNSDLKIQSFRSFQTITQGFGLLSPR